MRTHNLALHALAMVAFSHLPFQHASSSSMLVRAEAAEEELKIPVVEETFVAPENAESFIFEAEVSRMLDIVINSLYQNKDIFLRELISNASDALDKIRFLSLTKPSFLEMEDKLQIQIEHDSELNTLTVRDTGIGMTKDEMISNLGTVARSGTTRFLQALQSDGAAESATGDISQIGQFGVGFYSAFLVADRVQVASKHPESETQYIWTSANGAASFQVFPDPRGATLTRGSEITLFLKEECLEYADQSRLERLAKHYSEFIVHPIYLQTIETVTVDVEDDDDDTAESDEPKDKSSEGEEDDDLEVSEDDEEKEKPKRTKEVTTMEWEHLNSSPAIWTRPKDEIEDEEYVNFYKIISKDDDLDPERWIHFQAEGNINFKSIMYLPQDVPPSWRSAEMETEKTGLSLYVQKVLISDEFELLPRYLSFMRGVVDSDDLPLNVNRETLQESKIIQVIKKKVVRKALEMLKAFVKEAEEADSNIGDVDVNDDEEIETTRYNKFNDWSTKFSPTLKMGAIEDEPNRGKIMKLLRFKSTKYNKISWTSLDQYIENMKDWQKDIFFVAGVDQGAVEKSQFLEQFNLKGVEVLYFTDPIDEYLIQSIITYEGKKFKNIATDNAQLNDEDDEDLATRREKYYKDKFKPLTKWLKKLYGTAVMRVVVSNRLVSTPAIASNSEYGHSANMERIMRAQSYSHGQNEFAMRSMKIFELNPRHPFVLKLLEGAPPVDVNEGDDDFQVDPQVEDSAWILHEMALLNGGFPLSDMEGHTNRMMKFMQSQLGVDSLVLAPEPDLAIMEEEAPEVDIPKGSSAEDAIPLTPDEDGIINMDHIEL